MQSAFDPRVAGAPIPAAQEPSIRTPERTAWVPDDIADWLNRCLRTELSAIETYDLAVTEIGRGELSNILRQIRDSHERRAIILREYLLAAGREPSTSSGVWGAFAKAVQLGADLLGDRAAVAALEQFEDHIASLYTERSIPIDDRTSAMLDTQILPGQGYTSDLSRTLLHFVQSN